MEADLNESSHALILLGYGHVFGTVTIPNTCWAPIWRIDSIVQLHTDPIASLRGESSYRAGADLAGMRALLDPQAPSIRSLPVDFNWQPELGEPVFAVGYPSLNLSKVNPRELHTYLREGMFGAYGTISGIFPNGRDRTRCTPVIEVLADWQSGMSGGPVFNRYGQVIGVVSYSLLSSDDGPGVAYATYLSAIPDARSLTPSLDAGNPGHRKGFGVFSSSPWHLATVTESRENAEQARAELGEDYSIAWGVHRIGSDDFIAT